MHLRAHQTSVLFLLFVFGVAAVSSPQGTAQGSVAVYEIEGLVTDERSAPLKDASLQLLPRAGGNALQTVKSDAAGAYKFSMVAPGEYVVSASHDCCRRAGVDVTIAGGATLKTTAPTLVLPLKQPVASGDPVKLSGVVKSTKDQSPVSHTFLAIQSYYGGGGCSGDVCKAQGSQYFSIETDATGAFELDVNRGTAHVRATHAGFDATQGSIVTDKDSTISVPLRPATDNTLRLSGVLRNLDGQPIGGGHVNAGPDYASRCPPDADCMAQLAPDGPTPAPSGGWTYESDGPQYNSTQSQNDGSWSMRVVANKLRVTGSAPDHLEAHKMVEAVAGQDMTIDLKLERVPPDSVTIRGRVTDRDTGKPIAQASVSIENQKWGSYANTQTDADGRYELKTKPGASILTVRADAMGYVCPASAQEGSADAMMVAPCQPSAPRDSEYLPAAQNFDAAADQTVTRDVKLRARPAAQSTFQGWIVDAQTEKGIANAVVTFYNEDTRDWGSATTDADGSYKIKVHAGYYSVRVWAEHYFDAVANPEIGERTTQTLTLRLEPGEKRYGGWGCCAYAVADSMHAEGGAPGSRESQGAPVPVDGQKAYEGAAGGLGPYQAVPPKGSAPGAAAMLAICALVLVAFVRRTRFG